MRKKSTVNKVFIGFSVVPALIRFIVFMVVPTINVFWMSLFKWGGLSSNKKFVGLSNFTILFKDSNFIKSFQNTLFLLVIVTIITMILAIASAAVLTRKDIKFKNFFKANHIFVVFKNIFFSDST